MRPGQSFIITVCLIANASHSNSMLITNQVIDTQHSVVKASSFSIYQNNITADIELSKIGKEQNSIISQCSSIISKGEVKTAIRQANEQSTPLIDNRTRDYRLKLNKFLDDAQHGIIITRINIPRDLDPHYYFITETIADIQNQINQIYADEHKGTKEKIQNIIKSLKKLHAELIEKQKVITNFDKITEQLSLTKYRQIYYITKYCSEIVNATKDKDLDKELDINLNEEEFDLSRTVFFQDAHEYLQGHSKNTVKQIEIIDRLLKQFQTELDEHHE